MAICLSEYVVMFIIFFYGVSAILAFACGIFLDPLVFPSDEGYIPDSIWATIMLSVLPVVNTLYFIILLGLIISKLLKERKKS
jgi:hypothetical protein